MLCSWRSAADQWSEVIKEKTPYREMGGDYFEKRDVEKKRKKLIKQLEVLGLKVTVEELEDAA